MTTNSNANLTLLVRDLIHLYQKHKFFLFFIPRARAAQKIVDEIIHEAGTSYEDDDLAAQHVAARLMERKDELSAAISPSKEGKVATTVVTCPSCKAVHVADIHLKS